MTLTHLVWGLLLYDIPKPDERGKLSSRTKNCLKHLCRQWRLELESDITKCSYWHFLKSPQFGNQVRFIIISWLRGSIAKGSRAQILEPNCSATDCITRSQLSNFPVALFPHL